VLFYLRKKALDYPSTLAELLPHLRFTQTLAHRLDRKGMRPYRDFSALFIFAAFFSHGTVVAVAAIDFHQLA
jgi:hypothetical protein